MPRPAATAGSRAARRARSRSRPTMCRTTAGAGLAKALVPRRGSQLGLDVAPWSGRAEGSLASIASTSASRAGGTSGLSRDGGAGCSLRIACSTEKRGTAFEGAAAGQHLVEDDARGRTRPWRCRLRARPPAPATCTPACRSMGPSVVIFWRTSPVIDRVEAVGERAVREAEVEHLHVPVGAHHHVLRLDVAVHDARPMRRAEGAGQLPRDVERPLDRQRRQSRSPAASGPGTNSCTISRSPESVSRIS